VPPASASSLSSNRAITPLAFVVSPDLAPLFLAGRSARTSGVRVIRAYPRQFPFRHSFNVTAWVHRGDRAWRFELTHCHTAPARRSQHGSGVHIDCEEEAKALSGEITGDAARRPSEHAPALLAGGEAPPGGRGGSGGRAL
jgi:hypothetical protein